MSEYSGFLSTANTLIKRYGVKYTFSRVVASDYNPDLGKNGNTETLTYDAFAVVDNTVIGAQAETTNSDVDIRLIAQAADYKVNDSVDIMGVRYTISRTDPIKPGDLNVAQWVYLQK